MKYCEKNIDTEKRIGLRPLKISLTAFDAKSVAVEQPIAKLWTSKISLRFGWSTYKT
jgi:hypothetical protein